MSDENLHWSERAKLANSSGHPPVYVPPKPPPRQSNKKYVFVGIGLLVVAVIAVAVVIFFDPLGGDSSASVASVESTEAGLATTTSLAKLPTRSSVATRTGGLATADTVYTSTALEFTIECPEGWESFLGYGVGPYMDADESFGLRDPAGEVGNIPSPNYLVLSAFENDGTLTESLEDVLQGLAEGWVAELPRYFEASLTGHASAISVNGMDGAEVALTYQVEGLSLKMRLSMLESPTVGFMFIFNAYQEDWQTYEPVFDATLNSLEVASTG